jgi:MFS family permease
MRAFRHRDFRLFWLGAFISFSGAWVQSVAAGWLIFELTHDEAKLAFISFCGMIPVSIFGPIAGTLADTFNKRGVLIVAQTSFALAAFYYYFAIRFGFIQYWQFVAVSLLLGLISTIEMPTRQSVVSRIVPTEDLPSAIPLMSITFNLARVIGPAIGGIVLAMFGATSCFLINAISYAALIFAIMAVRTSLEAPKQHVQPIADLLFEGMRYTFKEHRLRNLFILEGIVSIFGMAYLTLMPAIAKKMLGLDEKGLGMAMTVVGIGAISALFILMWLKDRPIRGIMIKTAMTVVGVALVILSYTTNPYIAFPMLALVGMGTITQFNVTNTLFQMLSPERLRGRVLAMHIWAISGLGPIGLLLFGWIAKQIPDQLQAGTVGIQTAIALTPGWGPINNELAGAFVTETGLPLSLKIGGYCVLAGAIWSWINRKGLEGVP